MAPISSHVAEAPHTGVIELVRRRRSQALHSLGSRVAALGVSANALTIIGAALCILSGLLVSQGSSLVSVGLLFLLGSSMDAIDGTVARLSHRPSRWGAYLDTMCDKVGEVGLILGLLWRIDQTNTARALCLAAVMCLLSSYSKSAAGEKGIIVPWPEAKIVGRTIRVLILGVGLLVVSLLGLSVESGIFMVAAALSCFGALVLCIRTLRVLRHSTGRFRDRDSH
jgi:CDP-diacylglycerol--glycerol-3-phosphate 3-phosphatidyltransferase